MRGLLRTICLRLVMPALHNFLVIVSPMPFICIIRRPFVSSSHVFLVTACAHITISRCRHDDAVTSEAQQGYGLILHCTPGGA
jgi:hypothetical protein